MTIKSLHRYLSLAVAAIWLVQATTGILSVFRWEIDDATVSGPSVPIDYQALGGRIDSIDVREDASVSSIWTSGSVPDRFDIHYSIGDTGHVMRVNGAGMPLRDRTEHDAVARGGIFDTITSIHTSLWGGVFGEWLIGLSGILLLTNIAMGLKLAWPRRGTWRKAMLGKPAGGRPARFYGWHRKLGLWVGIPALFTISAGVMMVFLDAVESGLGAKLEMPEATAGPISGERIGTGTAMMTALARFPGSSISGVYMPDEESAWYWIRLHAPGEVSRKWGTTSVFVSAGNGEILSTYDASNPRPARAVVDTLYPLHTGQIGGLAGRVVVLAIGCWLLTMIVLGVSLWWMRRRS